MAPRTACSGDATSAARMVFADSRLSDPTRLPTSVICQTAKPELARPNSTRAPKPPYRRPRMRRLSRDIRTFLTGSTKVRTVRRGRGDAAAASGGEHRIEELAHLEFEPRALLRQRLRRGQHAGGRLAGRAGAALDVGNAGTDLHGALRRLLDVAGDFLGGSALLLHRRGDGRGDFRHPADRVADLLDGPDGVAGRCLDAGYLDRNLAGGTCGLPGQRLDLGGHHGEAAAGIARARGLDGGIERKQVGLAGDGVDQFDDVADARRGAGEF